MKAILVLLVLSCALPAVAQEEIVSVSDWRFHDGYNPAWAAPDLDDSHWAKTTYSEWGASFNFNTGGTQWYRGTFHVPDDFAGEELALGMGPLEEVYDVYIDGTLVGRHGYWGPTPRGPFDRHLVFPIPPGLLKGPVGHIAIRRKGLDASMLVAVILGSLANETNRNPASLLAYLNRAAMGRTGGGFITACCGRFYRDGRLVLANAGHFAPYLDGRELPLESGLPLGISLEACYSETEIETRGTVTFVSDGVVEARDANSELLGFERMAALTRRPAAEIAEAAERWGQEDDITVLCVTCTVGVQPAAGYKALHVALPTPESA